ncbi:hypothetical protein AB205_0068030, partial [Aquarana catesbeiana]
MEEDLSDVTEKIIHLTLEIIYLLSGESFPLLKSGDHMIITVPPCDSLKPERHNMEKILEVTKKMMELLTGEVPIRCQDVTVYFSMEEWEYLEGHKDLYKDVMMDNRTYNVQHDQSGNLGDDNLVKEEHIEGGEKYGVMTEFLEGHMDVAFEPPINKNPPERCPRPLYSRDSTQEGHTIPHHHQSGNLNVPTVDVKEGIKEEDDEDGMIEEVNKDLFQDTMVELSSHRDPPERPRHSTQEDHNYARPYQKEYSCPVCGKCYPQKSDLVQHQRSHAGEKPYSCPKCGKCFPRKCDLNKHFRSHPDEQMHT